MRRVVVIVDRHVAVNSAVMFDFAAAKSNIVVDTKVIVTVCVMAARWQLPSSQIAVTPMTKASSSAMAIVLMATMRARKRTLSDDPPVHERPTARLPICPFVLGANVAVNVRITIVVAVVNVARRLLVHLPCIDASIST